MERRIFAFFSFIFLQHTSCQRFRLCDNMTMLTRSCSAQILDYGPSNDDDCTVEYIQPDSYDCGDSFSQPTSKSEALGQVSIRPFIFTMVRPIKHNYTVPNIVFTDIKWKRMKFRVQRYDTKSRHCRNIRISDKVTVNSHAVIHYDCFLPRTDGNLKGPVHIVDLEATDSNMSVDRRQFLFYIPPEVTMSSTSTELDWKPFVYIEYMVTRMKLRIMPPPPRLNITVFQIQVIKGSDKEDTIIENITMNSSDQELIYDYSVTTDGLHYFSVTAHHEKCSNGEVKCQFVNSPKINLVVQANDMLYFYIIIILSLIAFPLFAYCIYRRYSAIRISEIPQPPKILVIYSSASGPHAQCVVSFVNYLKTQYGLHIMYDGDITGTSHGDPYEWAVEAFSAASHVMYIIGPYKPSTSPSGEALLNRNIFQNVDELLLSFLKGVRFLRQPVKKEVLNVFFEHSTGPTPSETRYAKVFYLLRDWNKLIAYLSKDQLPKKQIARTDKGKEFIEDLSRTNKLLSDGYSKSVES